MLNQPISVDMGQVAARMPAGFIAELELGDPRILLTVLGEVQYYQSRLSFAAAKFIP